MAGSCWRNAGTCRPTSTERKSRFRRSAAGGQTGTHYETVRFELPRGSRITLYSDGIVKAQNSQGELFGFERGRELSTEPVAVIVDAAKQFGQQDDITAISIARDAAFASAA